MASLTSVLALYSALDEAVLRSREGRERAAVEAVVEQYLPGSTGENAGWSLEIARFLSELPGRWDGLPSLEGALEEIGSGPPPTASVTGRIVYAIGALLHLPETKPGEGGLPTRLYADALKLAAPPDRINIDTGNGLLELLYSEFSSGSAWAAVAEKARVAELMSSDVSKWRPCESTLVNDGTVKCVKLVARYRDDELTLQQVKNILEPSNWPKISKFFCSITKSGPPGPDGQQPVLEVVSTKCPDKPLRTPLKFKKFVRGDTLIGLDYNLDPNPPKGGEGDGIVTVDRGSIHVRALGPTGVEVNTSKIVHISLLSPVAQNLYTCIMGYGAISQEMILGGARNPPPDPAPFEPSPLPQKPQPGNPTSTSPGDSPPAKGPANPAPLSELPVEAAVDMMVDCAKELTDKASEVTRKWAAGTLTTSDMIAYSAYVGGRMASDPWRFYELFTSTSTYQKRKGKRP